MRERGERGEHEQRAYSRVKSHHSVTVGWSMKRNLWDLLRHFSATSTCRTAGYLLARQNGDALFTDYYVTVLLVSAIFDFAIIEIFHYFQIADRFNPPARYNAGITAGILYLSDFSLLLLLTER